MEAVVIHGHSRMTRRHQSRRDEPLSTREAGSVPRTELEIPPGKAL